MNCNVQMYRRKKVVKRSHILAYMESDNFIICNANNTADEHENYFYFFFSLRGWFSTFLQDYFSSGYRLLFFFDDAIFRSTRKRRNVFHLNGLLYDVYSTYVSLILKCKRVRRTSSKTFDLYLYCGE